MTKKSAALGGKLNANRPLGTGPECREHGTRWKTGARGVLSPDTVRRFASQGMTLEQIGYLIGVSKQNIWAALKDEELNQAWCEGIAVLNYEASGCLLRSIRNDNVLSAMFVSKCRPLPGEKGWLEEQYRQKLVDDADRPRVTIYLPENGRAPVIDTEDFSVNSGSGD